MIQTQGQQLRHRLEAEQASLVTLRRELEQLIRGRDDDLQELGNESRRLQQELAHVTRQHRDTVAGLKIRQARQVREAARPWSPAVLRAAVACALLCGVLVVSLLILTNSATTLAVGVLFLTFIWLGPAATGLRPRDRRPGQ